ncbi:hypothetical protein TNCV_3576571 [Trichonephila clavipes]|nr:hypothetical protein TNCV_3576571 [Trichonephila clavipes]
MFSGVTEDIKASLQTGHVCSHPRVPRAHQAGSSRRSLAGVRHSESVRCHGPGLELLTNGGVQQQQQHECMNINVPLFSYTRAFGNGHRNFEPWSSDENDT